MRYVALLRAVNVGGTGLITMEDVRGIFADQGCEDVSTLGASGNVVFSAKGAAPALRGRIEAALAARLGKPATAILRTGEEMRAVVEAAPAPFRDAGDDVKRYVAFLDDPVGRKAPARMPGAAVEFPAPRPGEVYVLAAKAGTRGADPHKFLEKALGTKATARAWSVVRSLADLAAGGAAARAPRRRRA